MAVFWGDAFAMPKPDEWKVHAVPKQGHWKGTWQLMGTYPSREKAREAIDWCIDSGMYTHVSIEPHSSECGIFQSHAAQVVWEG